MRPYKRYALAQHIQNMEALGQLGGSDDLEEDIRLCPLQTIEPYFRKYLPMDASILEAGSGRGRWVFYLRRMGYDVKGIDIARSDIEFAKSFDPSVPITYDNVLATSLPAESFGAVISLGVIEHFEDGPQQAFAEVIRLLKPGGMFLVTVPTQNLTRVLVINRIKDAQRWYRIARNRALAFEEYRYSRTQFAKLLRDAGFEILESVPDDFVPPKNMGLYTDTRLVHHRSRRWELNPFGNMLNSVLSAISPWLHCSGTLWVCRKFS